MNSYSDTPPSDSGTGHAQTETMDSIPRSPSFRRTCDSSVCHLPRVQYVE